MVRNAALCLGGALLVVLGLRLTVWTGPKAPDIIPIVSAAPDVGDAAPRFTLHDQGGKRVGIGGSAAHWSVVSFFRQAGSPW